MDTLNGAPLRLIALYDLGYKSITFITRIELPTTELPGWWSLVTPIYPRNARVPEGRLRNMFKVV